MYFTIWIISGIIAGWLTGLVLRGGGFRVIGYVILGALVGLIGGWIFSLFGLFANYWIRNIFMVIVGVMLFIAIVRTLRWRR